MHARACTRASPVLTVNPFQIHRRRVRCEIGTCTHACSVHRAVYGPDGPSAACVTRLRASPNSVADEYGMRACGRPPLRIAPVSMNINYAAHFRGRHARSPMRLTSFQRVAPTAKCTHVMWPGNVLGLIRVSGSRRPNQVHNLRAPCVHRFRGLRELIACHTRI